MVFSTFLHSFTRSQPGVLGSGSMSTGGATDYTAPRLNEDAAFAATSLSLRSSPQPQSGQVCLVGGRCLRDQEKMRSHLILRRWGSRSALPAVPG